MPAKSPKGGEREQPGVVGRNLRRLRTAARPRLGRDALAKLAGISPATISNLELGYVPDASMETVRRLAAALGVEESELLEEHGSEVLDEALARFEASEMARELPGGPLDDDDRADLLKNVKTVAWGTEPPGPVAIYYMVLAFRSLRQGRGGSPSN